MSILHMFASLACTVLGQHMHVARKARRKSSLRAAEQEARASAQCKKSQQRALEQFLGDLSPAGDCCTWGGVSCNWDGEVIEVVWKSNEFFHAAGDVRSLQKMKQIQKLQLVLMPFVTGDLRSLEGLTQMKDLQLDHMSSVTGDIKSLQGMLHMKQLVLKSIATVTGDLKSLEKMAEMQRLFLISMSSLTGNIQSLGRMTQMQDLFLKSMSFVTGDIQSLEGMTQVQLLCLESLNSVTGDIQSLQGMTQMQHLFLKSMNFVTGDIQSLKGMTHMQDLTLESMHRLTGDIWSLKGMLQMQGLFLISMNSLTGDISSLEMMTQIQQLVLKSMNFVTGDIHFLKGMTQMQHLSLSSMSSVTGDIKSLKGMTQMQYLTLVSVNLAGDIKSSEAMTKLQRLCLSSMSYVIGDIQSLRGMTQMQELNFVEMESLIGNIKSLKGMTEMQRLTLDSMYLTGDIKSLEEMTGMQNIWLGRMFSVTGDIKSLQGMTDVEQLILDSMRSVIGDIKSLEGMTQMQHLFLESMNSVTGNIQSLERMTRMQLLSLKSMSFVTGDIQSLEGMTQMQHLSLESMNSVSGDIKSLEGMSWMQGLSLNHMSSLTGNIQSLEGMPQLQFLSLTSMSFVTGDIESLEGMTRMQGLTLEFMNSVTGDIQSLEGMSQMQGLSLKHMSSLTGNIQSLQGMTQMADLYFMQMDLLVGDIKSLEGMSQMQHLSFTNTMYLTGDIKSLERMAQIKYLLLSVTSVTGDIRSLEGMTQMQSLALSTIGSMTGDIKSLEGMTQMQVLALVAIYFVTGDIKSLQGMTEMHDLSLESMHSVTGDVQRLNGMVQMQYLSIKSMNSLTGDIQSLVGMTQMQDLVFDSVNLVTGDIKSLERMTTIESLSLIHVAVFGNVRSAMRCTSLRSLNIAHTEVSGQLPEHINQMRQLQTLLVRYNFLSGTLPVLPSTLQFVDVSHNNFEGYLPDFSNISRLEMLALQDNAFVGDIPSLPQNNLSLKVLLHGNLLSGRLEDQPNVSASLDYIVAVPGNLLRAPVPSWLQEKEAFLSNGGNQFLNNPMQDILHTFLLPCVLLSACSVLAFIFHRREVPPDKNSELETIVLQFKKLIVGHCVVGAFLLYIFLDSSGRYDVGRPSVQLSAAYIQGNPTFIIGMVWAFLAFPTVHHIATKFRFVSTSQGAPVSSISHRPWPRGQHLARCIFGWSAWVLATLVCCSPGMLYSFLTSVPFSVAWLPKSSLPPLAVVFTAVVQPVVARILSSRLPESFRPRILVFSSVICWLLPMFVVIICSQNCAAMWWLFEGHCNEPPQCCSFLEHEACFGTTKLEWEDTGGHLLKFCGQYFDVCTKDEWGAISAEQDSDHICGSFSAGTCFVPYHCGLTTQRMCGVRWPHRERCTMAVADSLLPLLMPKLLFAAALPLGLLLICRMACRTVAQEPSGCARSSPLWFWATAEEQGLTGTRLAVTARLRLSRLLPCCADINIRLSDMFDAEHVVIRLCIWMDLGIAWGPIMPAMSLAALLVLLTESWSFSVASRLYACRTDIRGGVPRALLLFGLCASYMFCICHLISALGRSGLLVGIMLAGFTGSAILFNLLPWAVSRCRRIAVIRGAEAADLVASWQRTTSMRENDSVISGESELAASWHHITSIRQNDANQGDEYKD